MAGEKEAEMNPVELHENTLAACAVLRAKIEALEAREGTPEHAVAAYERQIKAEWDTRCIKHSAALVRALDGWPLARVSQAALDESGHVRGERHGWDRRLAGCDSEGWRVP